MWKLIPWRYPVKVFIILLITRELYALSDSDCKELTQCKAEITKLGSFVQMTNTIIPALESYTWCLDLSRAVNTSTWTAFTYVVANEDDENCPELGFGGSYNKLVLFHLENRYDIDFQLRLPDWHIVCSTWDSITKQLEVFVNGKCIFNKKLPSARKVKPNGTLVLGINHLIHGGNVESADNFILMGSLYNFQMWKSILSTDIMGTCTEGNVVSWTHKFWTFSDTSPIKNDTLRCANSGNERTTTASTTPCRTTLDTQTTTLSLTTTKLSEITTTWIPEASTEGAAPITTSTSTSAASSRSDSNTAPHSESTSTTDRPVSTSTTSIPKSTDSLPATAFTPNMPLSTSAYNMHSRTSSSYTSVITSGTSSFVSTSTTSIPTSISSTNMPHSTSANNMPTSTSFTSIITSGASSFVSTSATSIPTSIGNTNMPHSTSANNMPTSTSYTSIISSSASSSHSTLSTSTLTRTSSANIPVSTSSNNMPTSATNIPSVIITTSKSIITSDTSMPISTSATSTPISTSATNIVSSNSVTNTLRSTPATTTVTSQDVQSLLTTPARLTTTKSSDKTTISIGSMPTTVTFYLVLMNISVSDGSINEDLALELTKNLIYHILARSDFAIVQIMVNEQVCCSNEPQKEQRAKRKRSVIRDTTDFIFESKLAIQATSSDTPDTLTKNLTNLFENFHYTDTQLQKNLSVISVRVQHLVLGQCPQEITNSSEKGTYTWMEKDPTETATVQCQKNPEEVATRYCNIDITTERPKWESPYLERCLPVQTFPDTIKELQNVVVTLENAPILAKHVLNLIKDFDILTKDETEIILTKITEIVGVGGVDLPRAQTILGILNNIIIKGEELWPFTNRILNLTEEIGYKMDYSGMAANVSEENMALSVSNVEFHTFEEIYFTVKTYEEGKYPEITLQKVPADKAVAYIYLPQEIKNHVNVATSKVQFNFFGKTSLFKDDSFSSVSSPVLNTYVVSASIKNTKIQGLNEPVLFTLKHIKENKDMSLSSVHCVFWDFNANDRMGGWNSSGCIAKYTNINYTTCYCTHLTHFGILLDLARKDINPWDERIMSLLTYVGCGIASLFLGISLVTYLAFKSLRKDYPSKILMNLSASLLMLNLIFLINNWLSSFRNHGLCITCAALLHYFLLASFTWMGLEAVHMYFAFVKVFNLYIRNYILKFCLVGWGVPAIVVAIVLSIKRDFYGNGTKHKQYAVMKHDEDLFCWIQDDVVFYVTVVAYFCFIFLINIAMFIVVLVQINSLKSKKMKDWKAAFVHDLKSTISLAFLLGLTWGFAFFAWGPVRIAFLYLFSIFNTLQGFFIFLFHCLMKENVRRQWQAHLCCGKLRLNTSDWSRLSNGELKRNSRISKLQSDSSQSTLSTATASTSNASSLSGFKDGNSFRNGGIFINDPNLDSRNQATITYDARRILSFLDLNTQ
ncbi:hypothetical protein XENTR_v10021111 [Xenopus tropicalis]|nr:hypothetical protein XENTR_v10021111 [Xenopus tropicalis]KAE8584804.1 hypothetical protein XENTR_v10021111 [Xenopus tropicalis]